MPKNILFLCVIAIGAVLFLSGCATPPLTVPNCGNGTVEIGEQCEDSSGCPATQLCEQCQCKSLSPPAMPE